MGDRQQPFANEPVESLLLRCGLISPSGQTPCENPLDCDPIGCFFGLLELDEGCVPKPQGCCGTCGVEHAKAIRYHFTGPW